MRRASVREGRQEIVGRAGRSVTTSRIWRDWALIAPDARILPPVSMGDSLLAHVVLPRSLPASLGRDLRVTAIMSEVADYLLPISDREPLAWIVAEQRTAVGVHRRKEAEALEPGDRIFLYTTRGCFRNPARDRGRVIGIARVARAARTLDEPIRFADQEYPVEVALQIESLAPRRTGVDLAPLLDRLVSFPKGNAWSAYMRRALVPLAPRDGDTIAEALEGIAGSYEAAFASYAS